MLSHRAARKTLQFGMACVIVAALSAILDRFLSSETHVMAATTPSYNTDIAPIFQKNCAGCHSSVQHKSGLIMDNFSSLMKGGRHGQVILPHDAKASRLMQMIEGEADPQMPLEADPLPPAQIAMLKAWINAGAPGPAGNETARTFTATPVPDIHPEVKVVSPVSAAKFSPDGSLLAVGGYREVRLISPSTGKLIATLAGHADAVRSIAFSPDGTLLAAAGGIPQSEGEIKIWNVQTHQLLKTMQGHKDCIYSIAWSPDGKLIASGSYDKMVKLWDVSTGKELHNLQDHIDAVFAVAFSPDGSVLHRPRRTGP